MYNLPDSERVVETAASFYWQEDMDDIVYILNKSTPLHTEADAIENVEILRELSNGIPRLLLIDVTHIKSMTRASREVYAKEGVSHRVRAVALVTNSLVGRIVGNFFLGFNKPEVPTMLFTSDETARKWLRQQH